VLRAAAVGPQRFASDDAVERIVLLGLPALQAGKAWRAALEGSAAALDIAPGPVSTTTPLPDGAPPPPSAAIVIRAPGVLAGGDWAITLMQE
jgi:hypothetical protein